MAVIGTHVEGHVLAGFGGTDVVIDIFSALFVGPLAQDGPSGHVVGGNQHHELVVGAIGFRSHCTGSIGSQGHVEFQVVNTHLEFRGDQPPLVIAIDVDIGVVASQHVVVGAE